MNLRQRLAMAAVLLVGVLTIAVTGYIALGRDVSLLNAFYMAVITIAGVGYGEIIPTEHNPALRLFNMFVVVVGVTITVYVFSVVTAFLVEGDIRNLFWRRKMQKRINELRDHFIVCGLGITGHWALDELHRTRTPCVVVELHEEKIQAYRERAGRSSEEVLYVLGDATDETTLDKAGIERARGMIVAMNGDKDNLVTTVMARQKNPGMRIVARCTDPKFAERMQRAGANATVSPNRIGGLRLASEALRPHVVGFLDLMLKEHSRTLRIEEIAVGQAWAGNTMQELDLRRKYNLLALAVKERAAGEQQFLPNPPDELRVQNGTVIIVMGDVSDLHRARHDSGGAKQAAV